MSEKVTEDEDDLMTGCLLNDPTLQVWTSNSVILLSKHDHCKFTTLPNSHRYSWGLKSLKNWNARCWNRHFSIFTNFQSMWITTEPLLMNSFFTELVRGHHQATEVGGDHRKRILWSFVLSGWGRALAWVKAGAPENLHGTADYRSQKQVRCFVSLLCFWNWCFKIMPGICQGSDR